MITISKEGNTIKFVAKNSQYWLQNGTIEVPVNSLSLIADESDMATFMKAASGDIFISAPYTEFGMDKDALIQFYKDNMAASSGGGSTGGASSVTFDLNNQWVASTKKLDGYLVFMSNSNKGIGAGYASMKIKFKGKPDFKLWINSYAEENYDYTIAFDMDVDYPTSNPLTGKLDTKIFQKDPSNGIDNFKEVDYPNDGGEHFVVVTYRKDDGGNVNDDRGYVAIKVGKLLSTSWVVSSTEFVKDNDKYYQRLNEFRTYEGGIIEQTGNFKSGNELTPIYIQSSDANDFMVDGNGMYYKKYTYVAPFDTAINTGDYIQGDYIGVAIPSMKVIYKDNTEETFYNLTSIKENANVNSKKPKNVEIYDGVTSIDGGAFQMCSSITSITLSNSITSIEGFAFYANGISSIVIHSSTKNIGGWAFRYCHSLSSVTIENSTSKLTYNEYAFDGISSSAKLYVPSNLLSEYQADENWTGAFPGGIEAIPPSVTVDLNNQWVASTRKIAGYDVYMSNSNKGIDNSYASMKIKFKGKPDFKIWINSYAQPGRDYTIAFDMDVDYPTSLPLYNGLGVKLHTSGFQKDPSGGIQNFREVDYPNDGGEHFVVVTYRKDDAGNVNDDRGYVAIKAKPLSTSWVLSSTEFIKENDKYYQRLNEVGTYEEGATALTGNFKAGNELTPTYIQSSDASDYILVGSKMYYKKYAWITPVDTAINTGDYIQGDYIGEATPSMKVTYTDNSEKTFYNLTSIEKDTDANKENAKNVEIYDSVNEIDDNVFYYCQKLESLILPNSITSIASNLCYGCWSLSSVTIPNSVTKINSFAFGSCSKLESIVIPNSVMFIGESSFENSFALRTVTIENSSEKIDYIYNAFADISGDAKLYVPNNLLADYQADENWTGAFPGGIYAIGS